MTKDEILEEFGEDLTDIAIGKIEDYFSDVNHGQAIYDYIDSKAAILINKVTEDNKLWGSITDTTATTDDVKTTYQEKIESLKTWIDSRLTWLYENINAL